MQTSTVPATMASANSSLLTQVETSSQSLMFLHRSSQPVVCGETWPYTCLSVAASSRLTEIMSIANRYGLMFTQSRSCRWHHLRPRLCREGDHKKQAVTMFVASIELIHKRAIQRALLYEVSQLHFNLLRALRRDSSRYSPDVVLAQHRRTNGVLTILRPTTLHLRQAGFPLSSAQQGEVLTNKDVRGMIHTLVHKAQASRAKTCSAF